MVGPAGLEPATKGFTCTEHFCTERTISSPSIEVTGGAREALACYQEHCSSQVVSAPSRSVLLAWLRIAISLSDSPSC